MEVCCAEARFVYNKMAAMANQRPKPTNNGKLFSFRNIRPYLNVGTVHQ